MSKATSAAKLVKWLANQGDDVVASAADLKKFGPQAAQVRALLDFIPTMSDDAVQTSFLARSAATGGPRPYGYDAYDAAMGVAPYASLDAASNAVEAAYAARGGGRGAAMGVAPYAAMGVTAGDLISPENYRILTNPLAAGRAVDVLGSRPRNQGTPFLDVVKNMEARRAITGPRDVVVASRLANKYDDDIIETALALMSDGMPAEEAMRTARML